MKQRVAETKAVRAMTREEVVSELCTQPKEDRFQRKRDLKALQKTQKQEKQVLFTREPWSAEEHERMIEGFRLYGKDINRVIKHVGTRLASSVKNRAHQLKLAIKKDPKVAGADILPILEGKSTIASSKHSSIHESDEAECNDSSSMEQETRKPIKDDNQQRDSTY